jgi:hypothetical protein
LAVGGLGRFSGVKQVSFTKHHWRADWVPDTATPQVPLAHETFNVIAPPA